jgi:hypothetical protein
MARIGISITKSVPFREGVQEFSNVYYYENAGALPDQAAAEALIQELTTLEKNRHSSAVTFVRGRLWSQVGSAAQNNMIAQQALAGVGALAPSSEMDRERAYLIRWRAGNDSRGNPVYLRKYYHACGPFGGVTPLSAHFAQTLAFTQAQRDTMLVSANAVLSLTSGGGGWSLVSKNGRTRSGTGDAAHKFLEHHQLGDMWRS